MRIATLALLILTQTSPLTSLAADNQDAEGQPDSFNGVAVEHRMRFRHSLEPDRQCGSPIECGRVTATLLSVCVRPSRLGDWEIDSKIVTFGDVWVAIGHFNNFVRVDDSVHDGQTAREHVFKWHVNPALWAVSSILADELEVRYPSRYECERAIPQLARLTNARFLEAVRLTQQAELDNHRLGENVLTARLRSIDFSQRIPG